MSRQITINSARLITPATPAWTPDNPQGSLSCDYIVGNLTDGMFIGFPGATTVGTASIPLDSTHTAPELYTTLAGTILALESLDASAGDTVLFS